MWTVLTWLSAGMGCTNVAPASLGKKQNVSNCASCYRINSHHPTDHDRPLLRLQLHWLWGLRSSQNHRTLLEFIGFAFGNNQRDVQSLQSYPECMFFPECGFRFTLGFCGLRVCSLDVAFTSATVRNHPQPFATVRNRSQASATVRAIPVWPCLW